MRAGLHNRSSAADALGRTIQTQRRHQTLDTEVAATSTRYDNAGRVLATTEPEWVTVPNPGHYQWEDWWNPNSARTTYTYPVTSTALSTATEGCENGANVNMSYQQWTGTAMTEWASTASSQCGLETASLNPDGILTVSVDDVRGNTLTVTDDDNRLTTAQPDGPTTTFEYNIRDQVTKVTDAIGAETVYQYGDWNTYGPDRVIDPDRGTTDIVYDGHGRLDRSTSARGIELGFGYDNANRPTNIWHVNSGWTDVSQWDYDYSGAYGQLGQARHWNRQSDGSSAGLVTQNYAYDTRGRLDGVTYDIPTLPGGQQTIYYSYHEGGLPLRTFYPDGTETEAGYTREGQPFWLGLTDPTNVANPGVREVIRYAAYNPRGQLETLKRGSASSARTLNSYYTYLDYNGRLDSVYTDSGASTPVDQYLDYDYSDAGRIWSIYEDAAAGSTKSCFWYDDLNRVTRGWTIANTTNCGANTTTDNAGPEPYQVDYSYDLAGRITSATGTGTIGGTYTYPTAGGPAHAPTAASTSTYTYDPAGNRDGGGTVGDWTAYVYDVQDRLTSTSNATTATMLYDSAGERVRRTVNGTSTWYLTSGYELAANADATISIGIGGRPVATYTAGDGNIWSQASDHLSTATFTVAGPSGSEQYRRHTPFGNPRSAASEPTAGGPTDLTFTNQRDDGDLDLLYYGARYHDPTLGQFTQPDSITPNPGYSQDWNRYAYTRNNPLTYNDPTGQCPGGVCLPEWGATQQSFRRGYRRTHTVNVRRSTESAPAGSTPAGASNITSPASLHFDLVARRPTCETICNLTVGLVEPFAEGIAGAATAALSPVDTARGLANCGSNLGQCSLAVANDTIDTCRSRGAARCTGNAIATVASAGVSRGNLFRQIAVPDTSPAIKPGSAGGPTAGRRFPESVRRQALDENPSTFVYCRMETNAPQVDHVIPRSRNGNATLPNAQTTCPHCNASKGARDFPVNPPAGYRGPWPPGWWDL